jgi:DNA-nicking Smr family endonuclease
MRKKPKIQGNKYASLSEPQASFDFHGRGVLSKEDIVVRTTEFVRECSQRGFKKILIITGKGLHSKSGPVVGPLVQDILMSLPNVQSVETARRDRGGEGALEVQLQT